LLSQRTANLDILLSLSLDLVPGRLLLRFFPVQVAGEILFRTSTARTKLIVAPDCVRDPSFTWHRHLLSVKLLVSSYILVRETLGFFACGCTLE
jgi:hypothetical protein